MGAAMAAWSFAIPLIANQKGVGTGIALALVVSWLLLAWFRKAPAESVGFALSWAVAAPFFVGEFGIRMSWYANWADVRFPLTCLAALGFWCLPWVVLRRSTRSSPPQHCLTRGSCDLRQLIAAAIAAVAVCFVGFGLAAPVYRRIANKLDLSFCEWAQIVRHWPWNAVILALAAIAILAGCLDALPVAESNLLSCSGLPAGAASVALPMRPPRRQCAG